MLDGEHHVTLGASGSESADMLKQRPCGPMTPKLLFLLSPVRCGIKSAAQGGFLANLIPKRYTGDSSTYNRRKTTPANVAKCMVILCI